MTVISTELDPPAWAMPAKRVTSQPPMEAYHEMRRWIDGWRNMCGYLWLTVMGTQPTNKDCVWMADLIKCRILNRFGHG